MLDGRPTLVVEEEFLIALDIQAMLEDLGAGHTTYCRTPSEAHKIRANWSQFILAVVEARMGSSETLVLVDALLAEEIPVILTTGDVRTHDRFADRANLSVIVKPVSEVEFDGAVKRALANRA